VFNAKEKNYSYPPVNK